MTDLTSHTWKLYIASQVQQYWLCEPCSSVYQFYEATWRVLWCQRKRGRRVVQNTPVLKKQSIDKHKVKGILGRDGENRDGRITVQLWKEGKLKVSLPCCRTAQLPWQLRPRAMNTHTKLRAVIFSHRIFHSKLFHLYCHYQITISTAQSSSSLPPQVKESIHHRQVKHISIFTRHFQTITSHRCDLWSWFCLPTLSLLYSHSPPLFLP